MVATPPIYGRTRVRLRSALLDGTMGFEVLGVCLKQGVSWQNRLV